MFTATHAFDGFINITHLIRSELSFKQKVRLLLNYCKLTFLKFCSGFIPFNSISFMGLRLEGGNFDNLYYLFGEIFIKNSYYFRSTRKQPVIIDCGANIGDSVIYFKMLYPDAEIHAFEPDPKAFKQLEKNVERNNLTNVFLYQVAVSDHNGRIPFYTDSAPGSLIMSPYKGRVSKKIAVKACDLAEFIKDNKIDFLKMDIEGYETKVLTHLAKKNMLSRIREMVIEYHLNLPNMKASFTDFMNIIEHADFSYQIDTRCIPLYQKNKFQDLLVYIYR